MFQVYLIHHYKCIITNIAYLHDTQVSIEMSLIVSIETSISLLIIPCMIVYVTNKREPWTLNLDVYFTVHWAVHFNTILKTIIKLNIKMFFKSYVSGYSKNTLRLR